MRLIEKGRRTGTPKFSGKVTISIIGLDQYSRQMSKTQGLPSKTFTVGDTTVDEVCSIILNAIGEKSK